MRISAFGGRWRDDHSRQQDGVLPLFSHWSPRSLGLKCGRGRRGDSTRFSASLKQPTGTKAPTARRGMVPQAANAINDSGRKDQKPTLRYPMNRRDDEFLELQRLPSASQFQMITNSRRRRLRTNDASGDDRVRAGLVDGNVKKSVARA
jgi:hypothetical protein